MPDDDPIFHDDLPVKNGNLLTSDDETNTLIIVKLNLSPESFISGDLP